MRYAVLTLAGAMAFSHIKGPFKGHVKGEMLSHRETTDPDDNEEPVDNERLNRNLELQKYKLAHNLTDRVGAVVLYA